MSTIENYYCRLCAEQQPKFRLISENSSNKRRLDEYISKYLPIKIDNTYDYAKYICVECANVILNFHIYVKKVETAQTKLRNLVINDTVTIKTQPPEYDEDDETPLSSFQDDSSRSPFKEEKTWFSWDTNDSNNPVEFKQEIDLKNQFQDNNLENIFYDPRNRPLNESAPLENNLVPNELDQEKLERSVGHSENFKRKRIWECYRCNKSHVSLENLQKHFESIHNTPVEFLCYKCQILYDDVDEYKRHLSKDHGINLTTNKAAQYECKICDFKSNSTGNYSQHLLKHAGIKKFKCDICGRKFTLKQDLDIHSLTHREEIPVSSANIELPEFDPSLFVYQFKCSECDETFDKLDILEKHMDEIHKDILTTYNCPRCDKILKQKNELVEHLKNDHKRYKCEICGKEFSHRNAFVDHYYMHKGVKQFACDLCDKTFSRKQHAQLHRLQHDNPIFNCDKCEKTFSSEIMFQRHQKSHERKEKERNELYECDICQKKFTQKGYVRYHKRMVHGENADLQETYVCEKCGKSFKVKSSLVAHETVHVTNYTYHCDKCPKVFKSKEHLRLHKKTHITTKPFKCHICGTEFTRRTSLTQHSRIHENKLPYECEFCKKRFREKYYLKMHLRQHTGEKPYTCLECNHSFTNDGNFIKHLRGRHRLQNFSIINNHQYPFVNPQTKE